MRKWKRWRRTAACCLAAAALACGCGNGIPLMSDTREIKGYSLEETMIVVATERNRYETLYTDQLFSAVLDEDGTTVEQYLLRQVQSFLEELKLMNQMAKDRNVSLTTAEKEQVRTMASAYYESLSEADLAYIGADLEDVQSLYEDYALANKLVTELTKDMDMEISDSEAKVITVQQIETWSEDTAQTAAAAAAEEGADFLALAEEYSVNPERELSLARGETDQVLETAAFSLAAGEISEVVQSGQSYYIFKCVSDYDQEATAIRKEQLEKQKKAAAFYQIYLQYIRENPATVSSDIWDQVTLAGGEGSETASFFLLYQEYFSQ